MSKKIGQALIERGLLSPVQLDRALSSQLIHGGHLGTSLIELGFIGEAALGRTLAEIHGCRHARSEMFDAIPPAIVQTVPREIARRRKVVPIGVEGRALHVGVIDPRNLSNLSTATGYKIVPYLAPEVSILQALERYYGVPRPQRFIRLDYKARKASAPRRTTRIRAPCSVRLNGPAQPVPPEMESLARGLATVSSRAELGDLLLDYTVRQMERALLFDVSGEHAVVANWRGIELDPDRMAGVRLPVTPGSIFSLAMGESYYRGPTPADLDCRSFYEELGMPAPQDLLILPIYGDDRLEAVIYGDGGPTGRIAGPEVYPMLLEKIALAMKVIAVREQLCPA